MVNIESIKNTELKPIAIFAWFVQGMSSKPCEPRSRHPSQYQDRTRHPDFLHSLHTQWHNHSQGSLWSPDWPMSCTSLAPLHLSPISSVLLIHSLMETLSTASSRMIKLSLSLAVKSLWISICGEKAVCRKKFERGTFHFVSILFESNFNPAFLFDFRTYVTTLNIILTCAAMIWL